MKKFLLSLIAIVMSVAMASAKEVTFDFVNNLYGIKNERNGSEYFKSGTTEANDDVTIEFATASGNGYRYWTDGLRLYKGEVSMTIKANGKQISSVKITPAAAIGSVKLNKETTATTFTKNTEVELKPNSTEVLLTYSISTNGAIGNMVVTYEDGAGSGSEDPDPVVTLGDLVVTCNGETFEDNGEYTLTQGDAISISAANAEGIMISLDEGTSPDRIDASSYVWTPEVTEYDVVTIYAYLGTDQEKEISFGITVKEKEEGGEEPDPIVPNPTGKTGWNKVTSNDEIELGAIYTIVCENPTNITGVTAMATSNANYTNNRKYVGITITDGKIIEDANSTSILRLKLIKGGENDYFWQALNYLGTDGTVMEEVYLNSEANNNRLYCNKPTTANENRKNSTVTITDNGNAVIKFVNCKSSTNTRQVFYNNKSTGSGGGAFNGFLDNTTDKDYLPVCLYRYYEIAVEPELTEHDKAIGVEGYDKVDVENVEGKCFKIILKHEASLGHNENAEGAIVLRAAKKQQSEVNMRRVLSATEEVSLTHDHESLNYTDDGKVEITLDHMPEQGDYEMVIPAGFFLVGDSNVSKAQTIGFNVDAEGNGTTGLAEISADKAAAIYDLQGRKVSRAGRGLFIQGGKVVRM